MPNYFKTRYLLNADGTDSATALTNSNTAFVHTYIGDDLTGNGTREFPFRSIFKANQKSGVSFIVFRGVINEAFSLPSKILIGDDINQNLITSNHSVGQIIAYTNFTCDTSPNTGYTYGNYARMIITGIMNTVGYSNGNHDRWFYLFLGGFNANQEAFNVYYINCTSNGFKGNFQHKNGIIIKYFDAVNGTNLKNMVFSSATTFKLNGNTYAQPNWGYDSKSNVQLARNYYLANGMSQANVDLLFIKDSFGNETCPIIKEQRAGGSHPNVFNKYAETLTGTLTSAITQNQSKTSIQLTISDSSKFPSTGDVFIPFTGTYTNNGASITDGNEVFTYTSVTINSATLITLNGASYTFKMAHANGTTCTRYGDVLDFTLNPDPTNEALWASDTGGYVGCFRPAVDGIINQSANIIDVNADGTDTANAGNLIQVDASGNLVFNTLSAQLWNRFRDVNCVEIQLGSKFKGLNAMSNDGSPFGTYIGKKQNLIDTTIINPGDALTVGTIYKVFNDSAQDVTKSILYNSVQYLPEYTFMCIAGVTTFSLLNAESGTYVKKVNADVLESIEILPYDNATTPSAFPKFSAPLMGECKLLYYTAAGATRYGKTAGNPVLFGDLANANMITDFGTVNDKMSYYDGYAVSNADQEFFTLANPSLTSPKSTYFTTAIPTLRFLKREINAHFDLPYDY